MSARERIERGISMKSRKIQESCLLVLALAMASAAQAAPTVVTFEDLGPTPIADGYGGIAGWGGDGGSVRENNFIPGGQGRYSYGGFNSAPNDGVGLDDGMGGLYFVNGPVVFEGAYFFNTDVPAGVDAGILLYYQGQLVHRIADPRTSGLEWLASGYRGLVDTLYFASGYDGFMIDDLTYSNAATVPEPGLPVMVASGLALVGFHRRGKRSSA